MHEYSRDESTSTDDHMYRSDQLATRPSPGNLSLIESDGTGEKLDSLASNGHGAASEPDIGERALFYTPCMVHARGVCAGILYI